jgi:probable addiction module antidote protein
MSTIFIGGSRHLSRLPEPVKKRLRNVCEEGHHVCVGDAAGADKAIQKFFAEESYAAVTVFCSGDTPRNNLGRWSTQTVQPPKQAKGFQFYAAKDRVMSQQSDFGLMIWDGKSPGTVLNVLRLVRAGKKSVLINVAEKKTTTFKVSADWDQFLLECSDELIENLRARATTEEWSPTIAAQPTLFSTEIDTSHKDQQDLANKLNTALASGDTALVLDVLRRIAKTYGMGQIAKDSGLARESLYRSLHTGGNPEFATVLKVVASLGLYLQVRSRSTQHPTPGTEGV